MCPIKVLGSYLALRGSGEGLLFTFSDGHPLTCQQLSSRVQSILSAAGYSGVYSGHSFRKGAATTADHLIKTLMPWSSDANQIYIRTPAHSFIHVSTQLAS